MTTRRHFTRVLAAAGTVAAATTLASRGARAAGGREPVPGDGPWTRRGTVPTTGGVIGYAIAGEGPPVVLLPKLGGWIADWNGVAAELARSFQVIGVDPPGHGTSRMHGPPPYVQSVSASAAMIRAALDEIGIERFAIGGNSLGGCIALTMAALFPQSVAKLVLLSSAVPTRASRAELAATDAKERAIFTPEGDPLPRSDEEMKQVFGMSPAINRLMNASRKVAGRWIQPSERGVAREGLAELLPRIEAPTLLVYGDTGAYVRHAQTAARLVRGAKLVTLPGAGSFVHQEKPAETARVLLDFLRS